MTRRPRWALVAVASLLVALACAEDARADDKTECVAAHTEGQELRVRSAWQEAQKRFEFCARSACPAVIVADCVRWYDELHAAMPSVIVAAKAPDGNDTVGATLLIDGVRVADSLSAMAVAVDPGEHVFRVEHSGWPAVERRVMAREGEKEQRVTLSFAPTEPVAPARSSPALGIVLVSLGIVAAGVAIPLGISTKVRQNGFDDTCGPSGTCDPGNVSALERDYWISGIVGGLGAVALGLGIWQLVSRGREPSPIAVSPGGVRVFF